MFRGPFVGGSILTSLILKLSHSVIIVIAFGVVFGVRPFCSCCHLQVSEKRACKHTSKPEPQNLEPLATFTV